MEKMRDDLTISVLLAIVESRLKMKRSESSWSPEDHTKHWDMYQNQQHYAEMIDI